MKLKYYSNYAAFIALLILCGCAFCNPLDRDTYEVRAEGKIVIADKSYQEKWTFQIRRVSSFNPYDPDGRQDGWHIRPSGKLFTLPDGKNVWIDLSATDPKPSEILGVTGAQPVKPAPPQHPPLSVAHPVDAIAPVYWVDAATSEQALRVWSCQGCRASIRYSVGDDYVGPSEKLRYESSGVPRLNFYDPLISAHATAEENQIISAICNLNNKVPH